MTVKGVHPPLRRGLGAFFQSFDGLLPRCRLRRPKEESEGADEELWGLPAHPTADQEGGTEALRIVREAEG